MLLLITAGLLACRTAPLPDESAAESACARAGGHCERRSSFGDSSCAPTEIVVQLPEECPDAYDCCVPQCPKLAPGPDDPCTAEGLSCQYSGCIEAICVERHYYLSVSQCS